MILMKYWLSICLVLITLPYNAAASADFEEDWLSQSVSIEFKKEPLKLVLGRLSKQTGVAIMYDEALGDNKVSGIYANIRLEKAISRLFARQNKSLIIQDDDKLIIVKHFGAKQYVWASNQHDALPSPDGMTAEELKQMHHEQYREYRADVDDDTTVLENGMTRREISAMHLDQLQQYEDDLVSGEFFDESGMTRSEVLALHQEQYAQYKKNTEDEGEILENGMTRSELFAMHATQYKRYKRKAKSGEELLENGMTRNELKEMHARQYEEYIKSKDYQTY